MLASELATELGVDPSVITKRLQIYHAESGTERSRLLDGRALTCLKEAHRLLTTNRAATTKIAVQMALGTYVEPVSSEGARELREAIRRLEKNQAETVSLVREVLARLPVPTLTPLQQVEANTKRWIADMTELGILEDDEEGKGRG
ncbi:hypothetical protein [Deinococcus alpinitundrae]|uniref:hypothetical protein n=1 Tax=Deinococcus alpinitundrae TaxID=468913 RepID=UPI001379DC23|nr:hypothetical protein [Deinococcus alpinitundrae]